MSEVEVLGHAPARTAPTKTHIKHASPRVLATKWLKEKWDGIQIESQGAYSIERLESLDFYRKTTSLRRATCICILAPIPASTVALLLECLPLQSPSEGWRANWVFWTRLLISQFVVGLVVNSQMIRFIPDLQFTLVQRTTIAVGVAGPLMATYFLAANNIGFPVPFMMQFSAIPIGIYSTIMMRVVLGSALFEKGSPLKVDFDRCNRFFLAFLTLGSVFPVYKVLYELIPMANRGIAVIILPIWKFASKRFMVNATRELEDAMLVLVALCVDFLSTLFVSVCMSTSRSILLMALFVLASTGQSLLEFRAMRANSKALTELLNERRASQTNLCSKYNFADSTNLLTIILDATQDSASFPPKSLENVRLWACLPYPLTAGIVERLQALEKLGVYSYKDADLQVNSQRRLSRHQSAMIAPSEMVSSKVQSGPTDFRLANDRSQKIITQGVRLLFHCEYVALVQYVECIVPIIFLVYKSVLEHLPNVVYYPGGGGNWNMASVASVSLFAVLEIGLFISFNGFVQRKFAFSPLHQVAFVLEREYYPVQAVLFCLILNVLQYELKHFGADFTFRFEWLRDRNP